MRDSTLLVGVHGSLLLKPWIAAALEEAALDDDVFSLAVQRAESLGLTSTSAVPGTWAQWGHNDAGGDWTQEPDLREIAWLQVTPLSHESQRLPLASMIFVLRDVLDRVGETKLTGIHTIAPLHLADDRPTNCPAWFATEPPSPYAHLGIAMTTSGLGDGSTLVGALDRLGLNRIEILRNDGVTVATDKSRGAGFLTGNPETVTFTSATTDWSFEKASWITQLMLAAARSVGLRENALVDVSIVD